MKKVLIISPHFPPVNAADMHRVRQSLPFFESFGWEPTVLTVLPEHVEMAIDELLEKSIPKTIETHKVSAYPTKYTRKVGLGNLGIRSFLQLYRKGNHLLEKEQFDLVYFSTTVFACLPLGRLWKRKYKVPFVIDMQDPWRNDYYLTVPKSQQPPKFWFAHRLNSLLEGYTMSCVDGIIAVSQAYIDVLKDRYRNIGNIPSKVLTFGAHKIDLEIASKLNSKELDYVLDTSKTNIIYAGVVPPNMLFAIEAILIALKRGINYHPKFKSINFHFIGTNYAIGGEVKSAVKSLILKHRLENNVFEHEERVPYFQVLNLVQDSKLAILPGTLDSNYTASKLYPYIMSRIPMIAIFHEESSVLSILKKLQYGKGISFTATTDMEMLSESIYKEIEQVMDNGQLNAEFKEDLFKQYESAFLCEQQVGFFNKVLDIRNNTQNFN